VKNIVKVKINLIESGCVGKANTGHVECRFLFAQEGYDSIDHFVIKDPTWFPDEEMKVRTESNVGRGVS
jgi:hypothetical protein